MAERAPWFPVPRGKRFVEAVALDAAEAANSHERSEGEE